MVAQLNRWMRTRSDGGTKLSPIWILGLIAVIGTGSAGAESGLDMEEALRVAESAGMNLPEAGWLDSIHEGGVPSRDMVIPGLPADPAPDIDIDLAARVAEARAVWQWGAGARIGSIVPIMDERGGIYAYDIDVTVDGSAFGPYDQVAGEWQEFLNEQRVRPPAATAVQTGEPNPIRLGTVVVSASYDRPPILCTHLGVSSFYSTGWMARGIAERILGTPEPELVRIVAGGRIERLYEFTDGVETVVVTGHAPWSWASSAVFFGRDDEVYEQNLLEIGRRLNGQGRTLHMVMDSLRAANAAHVQRWIDGGDRERIERYIMGYEANFVPLESSIGLSRTRPCLTQTLNYYDNRLDYGKLVSYFRRYNYDGLYTKTFCHVPNLDFLWPDYFSEDWETSEFHDAMKNYANDQGYSFTNGINFVGNFLDWGFDEGRVEIDNNRPFVWTENLFRNYQWTRYAHTAVGYDTGPEPDEWIVHQPWNSGGLPMWVPHSLEITDEAYFAGPRPGGEGTHSAHLIRPVGVDTWDACHLGEQIENLDTYTIRWETYGNPADHVDLYLSRDGGLTWDTIVEDRVDVGWYNWNPTCNVSDSCRIEIVQYDGANRVQSRDGSYGDFSLIPPICPPPPLVSPQNGSGCANPLSVTLDWTGRPCAQSYWVRIGTSCGHGDVHEVTTTYLNYEDLNPETIYYWQVRIMDECNNAFEWSDCWSFATGPSPPAAPDHLSPSNGAICQGAAGTLDWSNVAGAVGYEVQLGTYCGGSSWSHETTSSQYSYSGLTAGTTYYWRVRSKDSCDNYGNYSDCWHFTVTGDPPPPPQLESPPDGSPAEPPAGRLDWADVEGATGYQLRIGTSCGAGDTHLIDDPISHYDYSGLTDGLVYYWQVRTRDQCSQWGSYSGCFSLTTHAPATHVVRPDGSGDYPTIQAAIDASFNGDIIELTNGSFQGIGNRDLDYHGKSITIRSQNGIAENCIIDCQGSASENHRGFYFHSGEGAGAVLDGVSIRYGYINRGGAVYLEGSASPTFNNCEFRSNTATDSGGGIYCMTSTTPAFNDCIFYANVANVDGGGAYCATGSAPTFTGCEIRLNYSSFDGGGIFCWNAAPQLDHCVLVSNTANDDGGAASFRDGSTPSLEYCTLALNGASDAGGAVYCYGDVIADFNHCTFVENGAPTGGVFSMRNNTMATLSNTILAFSSQGVAMSCLTGSVAGLVCCNVYGNAGGDWVECIAGQGTLYNNLSVDPLFCFAANQVYTLHSDSPLAVENSPVCGQIGAHGIGCGPSEPGIVVVAPDGSGDYPTIQSAIEAMPTGSTIMLADGIFTGPGNRDLDYIGKGLTIRSQNGPDNCVIDCEGSAAEPHRAVDFDQETEIAGLEYVTIRNGYASDQGGALRIRYSSRPVISGVVFESNFAGSEGGAVFCDWAATPVLNDCVFRYNQAGTWGGALSAWRNSNPLVIDCRFEGNSAVEGGALDAYSDASPDVQSCIFHDNQAYSGGAINCESTTLRLTSCTLAFNSAPPLRGELALPPSGKVHSSGRVIGGGERAFGGSGARVYTSATLELENSIVAFSPLGEAILCEDGGQATASCSDVYGNEGGDWVGCLAGQDEVAGNLWVDPLFCDATSLDFAILYDSPCASHNTAGCGRIGALGVGCGWHLLVRADGSGDYPTIQAAIDAALSRDVIDLANGVYTGDGNRDLDYHGKAITVRSESGDPELCTINCEAGPGNGHRGVNFRTGEGEDSILEGVTIRNGYGGTGSAVNINGCSPTIRDCVFRENHAFDSGGAIQSYQATPFITDCLIEGNLADNAGGGMNSNGGSGSVRRCVFRNNYAHWGGGGMYNYNASPGIVDCVFDGNTCDYWGGGLHNTQAESRSVLLGCTFYGNAAPQGGAIYNRVEAQIELFDTILAFSTEGVAVYCNETSGADLTCCDVYGNAGGDWVGCIAGQDGVDGNFSEDPLFCDVTAGDFLLHADSPCAEGNNGECGQVGVGGVGCIATGVEIETELPDRLTLGPAIPNPSEQAAALTLSLPRTTTIEMNVYDASGRRVRRLPPRTLLPGVHQLIWDGRNGEGGTVRSGIYFLRVASAHEAFIRRVVLIR